MQIVPNVQDLGTPLIDGLSYTSRVPWAGSFYFNSVAQLEVLRRANGMRHRWFAIPDVQLLPIPAYESVEYQIQVQPGAYLWGANFTCQAGSNLVATNSVRIVDSCTEIPLQDRPVIATLFSNNTVAGQTFNSLGQNNGPTILAQPYNFGPPGLVNIEITNGSGFTTNCQLMLMFLEPSASPADWAGLIRRLR